MKSVALVLPTIALVLFVSQKGENSESFVRRNNSYWKNRGEDIIKSDEALNRVSGQAVERIAQGGGGEGKVGRGA